jgi:predicted short-subunit dehydrogenase-like oxidoreductase (DUF2520 family)
MLFLGFIDAGDAVEAALQRAQHRRQQCSLTGKDARHVAPNGLVRSTSRTQYSATCSHPLTVMIVPRGWDNGLEAFGLD